MQARSAVLTRNRFAALDEASRMVLLARCVSYDVNALWERLPPMSAPVRPSASSIDAARAAGFDMVTDGPQTQILWA
jgi:ParB family transcriptional regulator, chromosome partitioning protein